MLFNQTDATVIGSGPNGLAAAIRLAQKGLSVTVHEAKGSIGGGMRSAELTLPGFIHDICSAVHPLGIGSPFFRTLPLHQHGLTWIQPPHALAHPFDDGRVALLERSVDDTSGTLGKKDGEAYKRLVGPFVEKWSLMIDDLLAPLRLPRHPFLMARFGLKAILPASKLTRSYFREPVARGFFAGLAAHSILPFDKCLTGGYGLALAILGHVSGWPIPHGGSQQLANALASLFYSLGGKIVTNSPVESITSISSNHIILCDVTPRQLIEMAGNLLPLGYKQKLQRYRYGPGVFKIDWALSQPIPWKAKECERAGTLHLGGTLEEIESSESLVWKNKYPEKPFVLLVQSSLFDSSRAPAGKHTAWAYCHVPNGSDFDMTSRIENQIERFAPGFRDCIMAKSVKNAKDLENYNSNYIGGDIIGGVQDIYQFFTRPAGWFSPYSTPVQGLYICSSSTPPGGGVHGMCGYHAANAALKSRT